MTGNRNRSAWIWVAIAAIGLASVARAEAGLQSAKSCAHPVLDFLARSQVPYPAVKAAFPRFAQHRSTRPVDSMIRDTGSGAWIAVFPLSFIGLVSPLNLRPAASIPCLDRAPAAPLLPAGFQRPPPCLL